MPFTPDQAAQVREIYDATEGGGESGGSGAQGSDQKPSPGQKRSPRDSAASTPDKPQTKKEARQQVMDSAGASSPPRSRTVDGKFAGTADQAGQDTTQPQDQQVPQQGTGPNPGFIPKSRFDQVLKERREAKAEVMEYQARIAELEKKLQGGGEQQQARQAAEPAAPPQQRFEGFAKMPDFASMLPPNEQYTPHFKALMEHMGSFQAAVEARLGELGQTHEQFQQSQVQRQLDQQVQKLAGAFPEVHQDFWVYGVANGVPVKKTLDDWEKFKAFVLEQEGKSESPPEGDASEPEQSARTVPPRPARTVSQPEEQPKRKPNREEMRAELLGFANKVSRG